MYINIHTYIYMAFIIYMSEVYVHTSMHIYIHRAIDYNMKMRIFIIYR